MNNIGLKQNIEHLEKEYERFKRAGESGYFCDSVNSYSGDYLGEDIDFY